MYVYPKAKDQIVIDELSTHTDESRKELIHPYKVTLHEIVSPFAPLKVMS